MKQRLTLLAIIILIFISFQNCAKSGFNTQDLASSLAQSSSSIKTCTASTLTCETDSGYGQQTCTNNPIGNASLGPCVISSCKTGYSFVSGACVSNNCTPGSQINCDLTNGTGTRICDQTGQYGACSNPVCNAGFYLNSNSICAPEFIQVLVNNASEFTAVINNIYNFNITTSPGAILNDANSSLTAVSGSCPANRSWAPLNKVLKPWTLDGTSIGTQLKIGANSWNFSGSFAQDMMGCQWRGCVNTTTGASSCITIDPIPAPSASTTTTTLKPTTTTTTLSTTCTFNGQILQSGQSVTAYNVTTAYTPADNCVFHQQVRTCYGNGNLVGSFPYASCTNIATTTTTVPVNCTFNGQVVLNGNSVTAYKYSVPPQGNYCVNNFELRQCNFTTLSGSYAYSSCTDPAPVTTTTTTTTLPACPSGQQRVVNSKGTSVCGVPCNYQTGLIPNYLYKCANGVSVEIVNASSCKSGGSNYPWSIVYLTYVPSSTATYTCTAGNVFPY